MNLINMKSYISKNFTLWYLSLSATPYSLYQNNQQNLSFAFIQKLLVNRTFYQSSTQKYTMKISVIPFEELQVT